MLRLLPLALLTILHTVGGHSVSRRQNMVARVCAVRQTLDEPPDVSRQCLKCICAAARCDWDAGCRGGECGPFRISEQYFTSSQVSQVPAYSGVTFESCASSPRCANDAIRLYMRRFRVDCNGDGAINCDDFLMIHYRGPSGCQNLEYFTFDELWRQYRKCASQSDL